MHLIPFTSTLQRACSVGRAVLDRWARLLTRRYGGITQVWGKIAVDVRYTVADGFALVASRSVEAPLPSRRATFRHEARIAALR